MMVNGGWQLDTVLVIFDDTVETSHVLYSQQIVKDDSNTEHRTHCK